MAIDFYKMNGYDIQARYPDVSRDIIQHFHAEQLMAHFNEDESILTDINRLDMLYPKEFLDNINYRVVANNAENAKSGFIYSSQVDFVEDLKAVVDGTPRALTTDAANYSREQALSALPDAERMLGVLDQLPDFYDRVLGDCIKEFKRDYPEYKDVVIPFPAGGRSVTEASRAVKQAPGRGQKPKAARDESSSITKFLENFKPKPVATTGKTREKDIGRTR